MLIGERSRHHLIRLVAMLGRQLAMPVQHLGRRLQLFRITGALRRNLGGSRALASDLPEMKLDLLAAWARRLEVFGV